MWAMWAVWAMWAMLSLMDSEKLVYFGFFSFFQPGGTAWLEEPIFFTYQKIGFYVLFCIFLFQHHVFLRFILKKIGFYVLFGSSCF